MFVSLDSFRVILPHILLYAATIFYCLLGAMIFHRIELPFETEHLKRHSLAIAEAQETLIINSTYSFSTLMAFRNNFSSDSLFNDSVNEAIDIFIGVSMDAFAEGIRASDLSAMFRVLAALSPTNFSEIEGDYGQHNSASSSLSREIGAKIRSKWNFHSALFFTTTLLTSIGYGNLVPISPFGRIFCICYAFLGIPLTLITIADLAKFFTDLLVRLPAVVNRFMNRMPWNDNHDESVIFGENFDESSLKRRNRENSLAQEDGAGAQHCASRSSRGLNLSTRRMTLTDVEYNEKRYHHHYHHSDVMNDEEEENDVIYEPGFWTKNFVLVLLFSYMGVMAFIFTMLQTNWNFLDAFYFCLITLVTIGFGDFCPVEEGHYGGWIVFIFVGLILSTLTVDLVGSTTIEKIHTFGRGIDLSSLLTILGKSGPDSTRILQQLYSGSYQPNDLRFIPYIDQYANGQMYTVGASKMCNSKCNGHSTRKNEND